MKRSLMGLGIALVALNSPLYFALHDIAMWHGAIQLALVAIGAVCLVISLWMHDKRSL
jgi:hypothetical protein